MIPRSVPSAGRRTVGALALAALLAPTATATPALGGGNLDFSAFEPRVIQTIPGVTLVGGKSTFVRAAFTTTGTVPPGTQVDGILRVFVDGVEAPYSPVFSDNGPIEPPTSISALNENDTLNFIFLAPTSNDVELTIEINPPGPDQICETDFTNNTNTTGSLVFECKRKPELVYVPIDYRPGGGSTPNLPDENLIVPGAGDNFIQAIYPSDDWEYFRTPAGSKLWTGNLSFSGSTLNNSLRQDLLMMNPQPDFIYGWVPGSLPYNGQAIGIPGVAAMGNTQQIRHQRTFAHELGHLFGRFHINNTINVVGIDVERHLNITQGLPRIKPGSLFDIMVAGLLTNQAWVYDINYEFYADHPVFQCSSSSKVPEQGPNLLVSGLWNRDANTVNVTDVVAFHRGVPTETVPLDQADLVLRVGTEAGAVHELGLAVNTTADCSDASAVDERGGSSDSAAGLDPIGAFAAVLPEEVSPASVTRVAVVDPAGGKELAVRVRSDAAPRVELVSPAPGAVLDASTRLAWSATDADGDPLKHYVRYSPDGERLVPLANGTTGSFVDLDVASLPRLEPGGYFEILSSDGLRTTRTKTDGVRIASSLEGGNPPTTFILTPDPGMSFPEGATVVLHCSGYDLEDLALEGADVAWSSDLDGPLGSGRLLQVSDLSVGGHLVTVTATDSDGLTATDTVAVNIEDRTLPFSHCQPDIGFGGPGNSTLEVCGGDLSADTTATVTVRDAAPNTTVYVLYSQSNNPTPLFGGTLVPLPVEGALTGTSDANGMLVLPDVLPGGIGPATFYLQAAYIDPMTTVFDFSNAVQVDFLP